MKRILSAGHASLGTLVVIYLILQQQTMQRPIARNEIDQPKAVLRRTRFSRYADSSKVSVREFSAPNHVDPQTCRLDLTKVMEAALLALETGDVSTIQPQPCLQRKNESAYGSYEEVNLFQIWRRDDHNESIQGGHMAQVLTSVKAIYSTYASRCCEVGKQRALDAAHKFGFDRVLAYNESIMTDKFRRKYSHILESSRGAGFWMWKPYVVLHTLLYEADWGDYVCYADADATLISDPGDLVNFVMKQPYGIFLGHTPHYDYGFGFTEGKLQKRDNLILMDMDTEAIRRTVPFQANHMFLPKTLHTIQLVSEWLKYATDARSITDGPNELGLPNYPEFYDHRHDQAVLSLLAKKWGLAMWRDATQYGEQELDRGKFSRIASGPYHQVFQYWSAEN